MACHQRGGGGAGGVVVFTRGAAKVSPPARGDEKPVGTKRLALADWPHQRVAETDRGVGPFAAAALGTAICGIYKRSRPRRRCMPYKASRAERSSKVESRAHGPQWWMSYDMVDLDVDWLGGSQYSQDALSACVDGEEGSAWERREAMNDLFKNVMPRRRRHHWRRQPQSVAKNRRRRAPSLRRCYEVTNNCYSPRTRGDELPVEGIREQLNEALVDNQVLVVTGGTGSGKSTQVPQILLDDWRYMGLGTVSRCRIAVTEPRRMAAMAIAQRVAWEREEELGGQIGYSVRGSTCHPTTPGAWIDFCSVGTILRRSLWDTHLDNYDVIVIDEVHERDLMTDFLMTLLREVLPVRPGLRVVLMSATVDPLICEYFDGAKVIEVPSGPRFPIQAVFLDDDFFASLQNTPTVLQEERAGRREVLFMEEEEEEEEDMERDDEQDEEQDLDAIEASNTSDSDTSLTWWGDGRSHTCVLELMAEVIRKIVAASEAGDEEWAAKGSILCFLPGWLEIQYVQGKLSNNPRLWVVPLHGLWVSKEDQQLAFQAPDTGSIKVILATNIAESSITINDVHTVIDMGLQKELLYDHRTRMSTLATRWAPRSSAIQRAGRAGRIGPGRVFRLCSKKQYASLSYRSPPDMQRCDLATSCLNCIALFRDPRAFLAAAPSPPPQDAVETALEELVSIGAATSSNPPQMLPMGSVLVRLPMEPTLGRALLLGALSGLLEETAAMLAVSSVSQSPLVASHGQRAAATEKHRELCSWSDTLAAMKAMEDWRFITANDGKQAASQWATANHVHARRLQRCNRARNEIMLDARRAGLYRLKDIDSTAAGVATLAGNVEEDCIFDAREDLVEERQLDASLDSISGDSSASSSSSSPVASSARLSPEDEFMLVSILCYAYPCNVAVGRGSWTQYETKQMEGVLLGFDSVNNLGKRLAELKAMQMQHDRWLLYGQLYARGDRGMLRLTTQLAEWHVALFSGLEVLNRSAKDQSEEAGEKEPEEVEDVREEWWIHELDEQEEDDEHDEGHSPQHLRQQLDMDDWLAVTGKPGACDLILRLRKELHESVSWAALATRRSTPEVKAAVRRSKALLATLRQILLGEGMNPERENYLKSWSLKHSVLAEQEHEEAALKAKEKELEAALKQEGSQNPEDELEAQLEEEPHPAEEEPLAHEGEQPPEEVMRRTWKSVLAPPPKVEAPQPFL